MNLNIQTDRVGPVAWHNTHSLDTAQRLLTIAQRECMHPQPHCVAHAHSMHSNSSAAASAETSTPSCSSPSTQNPYTHVHDDHKRSRAQPCWAETAARVYTVTFRTHNNPGSMPLIEGTGLPLSPCQQPSGSKRCRRCHSGFTTPAWGTSIAARQAAKPQILPLIHTYIPEPSINKHVSTDASAVRKVPTTTAPTHPSVHAPTPLHSYGNATSAKRTTPNAGRPA